MKRFVRPFALLALFGLAAPTAEAQLYWDSNGTTAGAGVTPNGTWGVDNFWNTDSTGGAAGTFSIPTFSTSDVFFSAGNDAVNPYTVGLNSATQNARLVTFKDGTATLDTGTLSLGNLGGITVTSNTVTGATISSGLTISGSQTFNVAAGRTLTLDTGTFTRNAGATLNVASTGTVTTTMTNLDVVSLVNGIIGPWASHGSGASTRYATIDGSDNIVAYTGGTAAATAAGVTDNTGTFNYDVAAVGTLGGGANINTLRYTGAAGTIAGPLTTRGIMNVSGNALTFSGAVTGVGELVVNTANGNVVFNAATATGSYGLVKDGPGRLNLANADTTYSGNVTVNGGILFYGDSAARLTSGNITLNGGVIEQRWNGAFTKTQGSGAGQIQILGGESGFSQNGNTGYTVNIGAITWGSSTFNPSKFVLQTSTSQGNSSVTMAAASTFNLGGATRTILVNSGVTGNASATIQGVISNGGLIKEGAGRLVLSGANTFNGQLTVENGTLSIGSINNASANGTLGNSALAVILGSSGNTGTLLYTGGNASSTKAFTLATGGTGDFNVSNAATTLTLSAQIDGSGALTKNGTGTLTLSGTNNYGGVTTVNAGTLKFANEASLYNATPASWTAANLNVKSGATLQLNVDSAGTAGFTSANLDTLLGNISVANTAAQGLQAGATLSIDTSTATGGTFTQGNAITNSTGAFGGVINLTKLGAGTLVFDQANTYTGTTTISGGTLQLNSGGSIAGSIINNALYLVNQNATAGTAPLSRIAGSGSIAAGPSATITINTPTGLAFNALNTSGGGSFALSGVTTPTLGGLSGTTGSLSASFSSGYSGVTSLTLNTAANNIAGNSFTYGGVIDDGAAGMSLTKTGAGTQTLTGTNTYNGTTFLNAGVLAVGSGATIGRISGTTGLTFNGGTLQFNRSTNANLNAFNGATITVNASSTFGVTSNDAGGVNANETVGAVTLNAGQMNFNWTNGASSGSQMILSGLSRAGTASANFNGTLGSTGRWRVIGGGNTTAGQIIGPWYTTGGANAGFASTDYAVFGSDFIAAANIAGSAETTWTTAANAYTMSSNQTLTGTRTITALRNTFATAPTLTLAAGSNLETYGLLNAGSNATFTIAPGTGGVLTTPSGGGNLYVTSGPAGTGIPGAITVTAPINNNGGNVALVKNGSGTLTLTSTSSNFSGGVVLNAGTISIDDVRSIGGTNNAGGSTVPITVNGSSTISMPTNSLTANFGTGAITIANGATLTVGGASRPQLIFGGAVTGDGGVATANAGGSFWQQYRFNSTANTFTGAITDSRPGNDGINNAVFSFNSIADGVGYGNIILNGAANSGITYGSGAIAALNLNHRQIILANNNAVFFANASSQAVNINTDIGFSGTGARQIRFGITGAANHGPGAGINTINGMMTDNVGGAFSPTVGGGTWAFSNSANTYTGVTSITGGTLQVSALANGGAASSIGASTNAAGNVLLGNGATLLYNGTGHSTDRNFTINGTAAGHQATINSSGAGAINFTSTATPGYGTVAQTRTLNLGGSSSEANTLAATLTNNTSGAVSLNKNDGGRWILTGTNTYNGTTSINGGALQAVDGTGLSTSSILQIRGGVFQSSGTFSRNVGTAAGNVNWSTSSGGFASVGSNLLLNLNGGTASVTWNGTSMVSTGQTLIFGSASADSLVDFQNGLNLGSSLSGQRTIQVNDNTNSTTDIARISGQITNTVAGWGIIKTGAGTLELTNANTYTGATTVSGGTLLVNNTTGSGTGTGTVSISSLATLGGNGTISGATTIDGFHTPGNSPGIQTFGDGLTYGGASTLVWELIDNTAAALDRGTDYDGVNVTSGSFVLTSGAEIDLAFSGAVNFANAFWQVDQEWLVVDLIGGATAADTNLFTLGSITGGGYSPTLGTFEIERKVGSNAANSVYLTWVAVPEPSTIALLGVGVAIFGFHLARRRKA